MGRRDAARAPRALREERRALRVVDARVRQTSGEPKLDEAALRVARIFQFTPARNRDLPVAVWIALPIVFKAR